MYRIRHLHRIHGTSIMAMAKRLPQKQASDKRQPTKTNDSKFVSSDTSTMNKTDQTGPIIAKANKIQIMLYVKPNAKQSTLDGLTADHRLSLRIAAPARDNKANEEVIRFMAQLLDVNKTDIRLLAHGQKSREKCIELLNQSMGSRYIDRTPEQIVALLLGND
ncbi:hypothetical protein BDF22DRAFT_695467 [Syncephalis plumigaleata]|nr:hypothetical protein BDF22DRAFT_695467 [Syncephalis plumigaleata]